MPVMLKLSPRSNVPACAGRNCHEAETCLRYTRPAADQTIFDHKAQRYPIQLWASYDIERMVFNDCPARIPVRRGVVGDSHARYPMLKTPYPHTH